MSTTTTRIALLGLASLSLLATAAPTTTSSNQLATITSVINSAFSSGQYSSIDTALSAVQPTATPSSVQDAQQRLLSVHAANSSNIYDYMAYLEAFGLIDSLQSLQAYANGVSGPENSNMNNNPPPPTPIYPKKASCDAPYTVSEAKLRGAIYIPPNFTYGKKTPVILYPGTGSTGYTAYRGNFIKLLQGSDFADPVWINEGSYSLDDAQSTAEYVAYATNYIAAITKRNVTYAGWSQGSVNSQWAMKYWPSARRVTSDIIVFSGDYSGTLNANFITPPGLPMPPAVLQQRYLFTSQFIQALRANGGDSAYVPTTTIFSGFEDEIITPQTGSLASSSINDARRVGVSNTEVQVACAGQPAGSFYPHEGILYNPLSYALLKDAITHDGPGQLTRIDLKTVCSTYLTPGLNVADFLLTENAIAIAGYKIITYQARVVNEPPIRSFARNPPPSC